MQSVLTAVNQLPLISDSAPKNLHCLPFYVQIFAPDETY